MGNVLLPFDHKLACQRVAAKCGLGIDDVYALVIGSGLQEAFERGHLTPSEFSNAVSTRLRTQLDESWLRAAWSDIFWADQEMLGLVAELSWRCELHLISNTNIWHFTHVAASFPILEHFPRRTLSYEVGSFKPEAAMFRCIADNRDSGRLVVYVDDIPRYVEAATLFGAKGIVFSSCDALRVGLQALGLL